MTLKQKFYDSYHKKNNSFYRVIKKNNFTYYEILRFFYDYVEINLLKNKSVTFSEIKVLDVGCGVGTMALYFASLGINVKGIDISKRAIDIAHHAKQQLKLKNINFTKKTLQKGTKEYDLVLTSEVIEHIEDEKQFLSKISSQLKPGGLLYLTTPLKENYLYKIGFYTKFDQEVGHLRRYTVENIQKLLRDNGFKILNYKEVEGPLRNLLFTTKMGLIIRFIKGPLIPIFHYLDWISMKLFGASDILILAQKKSDQF